MKKEKPVLETLIKIALCGVLAVYAFVLVKMVLLKYGLHAELRSFNFIPFQFAADFLRHDVSVDVSLKNILGNFALFIPIGILLPALCGKADRWYKGVLAGFIVSLTCEILQYVFGLGAADVDDLILNTLGAAAGSCIYFGLIARLEKRPARQAASLAFLCVFGMLGLVSLYLYAPGELPAVIEKVNMEVLGSLDPEAYAYSGDPKELTADAVTLENAYSREGVAQESAVFPLADGAEFYRCTLSYKLSPNGNIQKTVCTYAALTLTDVAAAIQETGPRYADVFTDETGACTAVMLTIYQD